MWIRIPGKIKAIPALAAALAILSSTPVLGQDKDHKSPAPASAIRSSEGEITFNGKVFCSLKRRVDLPFKGVITSLKVRSGERVTPGQVLASYHLAPEAVVQIRQRLSPAAISDTEVRLAEMEQNLSSLKTRQRELNQMLPKKLAPPQSLAEVNRNIQFLGREMSALQRQQRQNRQLAKDDLALLKAQLGNSLTSGQIPTEAVLRAPIAGYIILISPDLKDGAEMDPTIGVFQIGVMDPMVVRAQAFEIEALQIKPDETAEITLESLPGRKFEGKVSRISWASMTPGLEQPSYYDVEIKVPNPEMALKDGLKAQIAIRKSK